MLLRSALAAISAMVLFASPAMAGVTCYLGASAGKSISATSVNDPLTGPVTIAADGLQAGIEGGCDYTQSIIVIGALARYELMDVSARLAGGTIDTDQMWTLALRAGVRINPDLLAYGMAGYSGTDITMPGLNYDPTGITYGAGLEFQIAETNLAGFVEWSRTQLEDRALGGTNIKPEADAVRVGLRMKFDLMK